MPPPPPTTSYAIAPFGDMARVRDLLVRCDLPVADLAEPHPVQFLAATDTTGVRGIVGLEPYGRVGLLRSLAVHAGERQRGCGQALLGAVEDAAYATGVRHLYLLTTTAAPFFARFHYRAVPRDTAPPPIRATHEFSTLCPGDATLMVKHLQRE